MRLPAIDRLLPHDESSDLSARTIAIHLLVSTLATLLYGATMGAFALHPLQMLYSAVKVPMFLSVASMLSLPSFFIANTLLGLRNDFGRTIAAMLSAQAAMSLALASLSPLVVVWYCSDPNYQHAILFNGIMFAWASALSHVILRRHYRPLIELDPRHRTLLRAWLVVFTFVAIQMGWVLRPFIGQPDAPTRFLRDGAWSNAYVSLAKLVWSSV